MSMESYRRLFYCPNYILHTKFISNKNVVEDKNVISTFYLKNGNEICI